MIIDGFGLPSGVGKDRVVDFREDSFGGQGEQGAGLDASTERKGAELGAGANGKSLGGAWRRGGSAGAGSGVA